MIDTNNNMLGSAQDANPVAAEQKKSPYTTPVLRVYGSVSNLTLGSGGSNIDGNMNNQMASDRSTKENIVRIGDHPLGIGLYLFDYKPEYRDAAGHRRHLGVMANEVETVLPEAVVSHPDGYKMVDYAMLARASRTIH